MSLLISCSAGDKQIVDKDKLCQALESKNKNQVKRRVNEFLDTLSLSGDRNANFENIKAWLEAKSCIKQADISDRIIETEPPIVVFEIVMESQADSTLALEIRFDESEYRFYDLKGGN